MNNVNFFSHCDIYATKKACIFNVFKLNTTFGNNII